MNAPIIENVKYDIQGSYDGQWWAKRNDYSYANADHARRVAAELAAAETYGQQFRVIEVRETWTVVAPTTEVRKADVERQNRARLAVMPARILADPETVAEIHEARCPDCKGSGCAACLYSGQKARRVVPVPTPAQCRHDNTPRPDVTGDPIAACAKGDGGTEWGAFSDEGCYYAYDCAVDVANESAKTNTEEEADADDPVSTWGEMCRDHRDQEQPKDGCEECNAG